MEIKIDTTTAAIMRDAELVRLMLGPVTLTMTHEEAYSLSDRLREPKGVMVKRAREEMDERAMLQRPAWIERTKQGGGVGARVRYWGIKWEHEILFGGNWIVASVEEVEAVLERML